MTPLLELRHIEKYYPGDDLPVLSGVDFSLHDGEVVCIMGPSGSGKTTLLHIMALMHAPTKGELLYKGKNMIDASPERRKQYLTKDVGLAFQSFQVVPYLTLEENISLPLMFRKDISHEERRQRVYDVLECVELGAYAHKKVSELSGGQRQRVAIARATVGKPHVIFADEPTGNLDDAVGMHIMDLLIAQARQAESGLVYVTHEERYVGLADRVLRIKNGHLEG